MSLRAQPRWKEEIDVTDEAGRSFVFDGVWGVSPPVAYVPPEKDWQRCVPDWLEFRRDEVIAVLETTGHVVREGEYPTVGERCDGSDGTSSQRRR